MIAHSVHHTQLEERHLDHLRSSAISDEVIAERGYTSIAPGSIHDWRQLAGNTHKDDLLKRVLHKGALAFPLRRLGSEVPHAWILRPDQPRESQGKIIKYEYPRSVTNVLDVLPRYRTAMTDPNIDLWITEGAKKADALTSAYGNRIAVINENGVWGWRSNKRALDDFTNVVWEGRRIVIAPDGDVKHNKAVHDAVKRLAAMITARGALEVSILMLPCEKNGPKIGVDDYLAQRHSISALESHLHDLFVVTQHSRIPLMKHPVTGESLFLPSGYDVRNQTIVRSDGDGRHVYSGRLAVTEIGHNPLTDDESVTVTFDRNNTLIPITVPRVALTSSTRIAEALGARGAALHAGNAREVSRYLVEFIRENEAELPSFSQLDRMGNIQEGLYLPAGAIGLQDVRYSGKIIPVGTNHDIYPAVLKEIAHGWDGPLTTFWLTLGLTLASPALGRMRPDRNPILLLSNTSGAGKTTLIHFAQGCYGDPRLAPLSVQCGSKSTTPKGIAQNISQVNGLPIHLEDTHVLMQRDPSGFTGLIYDFANGQTRSYGTLDQRGGGGTKLGGCMLMSGEATPELQYEGSQKRILIVNCYRYAPLGVPAKSDVGGLRAKMLTDAWRDGAGLFGHRVCESIWANWEQFCIDATRFEVDPSLNNLQAWRPLLAVAAQTLKTALTPLGITLDWGELLRQWASIYADGQEDRDPSIVAFEKILMMLSQSERRDNAQIDKKDGKLLMAATWEWLYYENKPIAARRIGEDYWRVFTMSPQWASTIGPGVVEMFGPAWLTTGHIQAHKGKKQVSDRIYTGPEKGNLQCILLPSRWLPHQDPDDKKA